MKQYRTVNNLMGWLTFIIAATVYCLTIEPTASFWDCPEFITTGYKLEVGHPPGAPFFMLMANLFTQFASDVTTVAKMVNYMSALMSGACILFLFWSITHLVRKLIITDENNITKGQLVTIMGSGLVGALVCILTQQSDDLASDAFMGNMLCLISSVVYAVYLILSQRILSSIGAMTMLRYTFSGAAVSAIIVTFITGFDAPVFSMPFHWTPFLILMFVLIFPTTISYMLLPVGLKYLKTTVVAIYGYLILIVATIASLALGQDRFSWTQTCAIIFICIGVYLVEVAESKDKSPDPLKK